MFYANEALITFDPLTVFVHFYGTVALPPPAPGFRYIYTDKIYRVGLFRAGSQSPANYYHRGCRRDERPS